MLSYETYYAVWVLLGCGAVAVGGFVLAALRYMQLVPQGFARFLAGDGLKLLIGDRALPAPDSVMSAALMAARIGLLAALPCAFITAFLTAHA